MKRYINMKRMKNVTIYALIALFLVSCGQGDKTKQLEKLKTQQQKISEKIEKLENELKSENKNNEKEVKTIAVKTKEIKTVNFKHTIEVQGNIESDKNILIPSQSQTIVKNIYVSEGDKVSKGQLLAEMDASIMKKSIAQLEKRYELAKTVYERQKRLWDKEIGSEIQYLQSKNNKEALEKQLAAMYEQYKLNQVISPITGTIDEINLKVGESGAMGGIRVVRLTSLKIKAPISENYINDVKVGNKVIIEIPSIDTSFERSILAVSKVISDNRTFNIELSVPSDIKGVLPNMNVVLTIADYKNKKAIVIPRKIVHKKQNKTFVFISEKKGKENIAKIREVVLGKTNKENVEIISGLKEGDKIITDGHNNLSDGQVLIIKNK